MINPYIFREYDIRGVVPDELNDESVELLGKGIGTFIRRKGAKSLTVGGDVRLSTEQLRKALMKLFQAIPGFLPLPYNESPMNCIN